MSKQNPVKIDGAVITAVSALADKYHLELVVLFGSQASGHIHNESDVDIGFIADDTLTLDQQLALREDLLPVFGRGDIEVVNLRTISPSMQKSVAETARVLFEKDFALDRFSMYAHKLYIDAAPLRAMRAQYLRPAVSTV